MAPLLVLIASFAVVSTACRLRGTRWHVGTAGRAAATVMFLFTGVSHFIFTAEMTEMVPPTLPAPRLWVHATGILEILGGLGLLLERTRRPAAWCLALFLVAVFPANVHAAMNAVGMGGHQDGLSYLWFRAPLQVLFLAWVVGFGLLADRRRETDEAIGQE